MYNKSYRAPLSDTRFSSLLTKPGSRSRARLFVSSLRVTELYVSRKLAKAILSSSSNSALPSNLLRKLCSFCAPLTVSSLSLSPASIAAAHPPGGGCQAAASHLAFVSLYVDWVEPASATIPFRAAPLFLQCSIVTSLHLNSPAFPKVPNPPSFSILTCKSLHKSFSLFSGPHCMSFLHFI